MDYKKKDIMITEDYVSFETAKLLKERGFDGGCMSMYVTPKPHAGMGNPNEAKIAPHGRDSHYYDGYLYQCEAPTLQMAMKWLRNKHDIVCSVGLFTDLPYKPPYWSFNILNQSTANVMYEAFDIECETYEEACEVAIKYCLENLI